MSYSTARMANDRRRQGKKIRDVISSHSKARHLTGLNSATDASL